MVMVILLNCIFFGTKRINCVLVVCITMFVHIQEEILLNPKTI